MIEKIEQLVKGCKSNERNAQAAFYKLFYGYAMSICLRYSNSRAEAEEILNDGFLKVFSKIDLFNTDLEIKAWMSRIFVNTAIDHFRKNKKHYHQDDIDEVREISSKDENILDSLSAEEIMKLVQNLAPSYQLVFNLYVVEGYKHHEIAAQLGISEGTSKSNLSMARAKLKRALDENAYSRTNGKI
jgi:RNA polymerase sigma factor (sigma-70 family)